MASSSKKVNLLGKRKPEDGLETKPFLRKHKEKETTQGIAEQSVELLETKSDEETVEGLDALRKKMLFVANLSPQTQISDIINFFKDVAEPVQVRLLLDHEGKHVGCGYVEFASANEAKKALEKKKRDYLHYRTIILDETSYFVEELAVPKTTLFFANLPPQTQISDIINFFKYLGKVVRVRFVVNHKRKHVGNGFVEFASANQAKKALEEMNGEYLHDHKIFLDVAYRGATYLPPPKYCLDHKVWYEEDYLPIEEEEEEDATVEGLDKTPDFAEAVLLIANLSSQTTKIMHIIHFFKDFGKVVSVRLIVNHEGKNVGYGFVRFASAYQAKNALEEKNGEYLHDHQIFFMKGLDKTPDFDQTVATVRNETLFVANLSNQTQMSDIINFFKDVGQVVHVRRVVNHRGRVRGFGFVGFASADEAKKALEKKNGEYLHNREIILGVANHGASKYREGTMYRIDHKVWYEDYIERESLLIEEDVAAVEETPDFAEIPLFIILKICQAQKKRLITQLLPQSQKMTYFGDESSYEVFSLRVVLTHLAVEFRKLPAPIFKDFVRVRLIVDHKGKLVGCFFVEFAFANEAKKAVQEMNGGRFFIRVAERDRPYPFRPKYNLTERLWYEDNLLRKNLCEKSQENLVIQFSGKRKRTTFSDDES